MRNPPPPPPSLALQINDHHLNQLQTVKLLGVHIQQDLKWDTHIDSILQRANSRIHMIRVLKGHGLPADDLVTIYKGYLRPLLEYAVPLWNGAITQQHDQRLERIQKRVIKLILGGGYNDYLSALESFNLQTLNNRRSSLCLKFASELTTKQNMSHLIPPPKLNQRVLRKTNLIPQPKCKTNRFRDSAVPYMISLLNSQ